MVVKRSEAHLSKDSKVEVCSNEEGYRGAWFPAIILDPQPSDLSAKKKRKSLGNSSKALVQYETLVSDDDPNKPLTELVDVCSIRPVPPPDNPDQPFEPADVVDSFYLEAWWVGVVMRFEDDKYTVGFKNPPDLLELRRSELRPHWDFLDGVWIRARKERIEETIFSHGTAVEINPNENNLLYAWFPAIYLGELGVNSFLLQYKSTNNCDVKVVVNGHQIRPQPPKSGKRDFNLMEMVDAFYDMGWWVGEITQILTEEKYMVRLKFTKQVKECSPSELRPHVEWTERGWITKTNGTWVDCSKDAHFSVDYEVQSKRACESFRSSEVATALESSGATKDNNEVKTACSRISWKNQLEHLSPCIDKSPYGKTKKKLKINQKPNDDATILRPSKKLTWGHPEDSLSFTPSFSRRTPVKTLKKEAPVRKGAKTKQQQVGELDNQEIISYKQKGKPRNSQGDIPWPRVRHEGRGRPLKLPVKKGSEIENADEEDVEDEYGLDNIESSGIRSDSELTGGSHAGTSCLLPVEEVEWNENGVSNEIKGKGKLPEYLVEHPKDPATDHANDIFELPVITMWDLTGEKHNGTGVVAQVESTKTQVVNDNDATVEAEAEDTAMDIEKIIEGLSNPAGFSSKQNEVRGRQVETGLTASEEVMKETKNVDSAMDYSTKEVQVAVTGISATASAHDQPLSLCIDEMHSVKAIECSSNPARTANQQNDVRGTQVEQQDSPHSPFVRSSPFWKSIESMEVFKRFPQRPHFHPLMKCKAVCREGSALGNMITFASLVEKTSKLQVGDPRDLFDSNLEALVDLEVLGFDVTAVRHRLKELIEMKVKLGQLENQSKEVDIQITECTLDRIRNSETISRIDKEIEDLKEKRATLMSIDVAKGSEISKLQSEVNAITEGIQSIHHDFEKLAAAAW
ncbi:DUF724 domain-containing protein 3-like isoform X2 [Prunus avium]|uniref:DUF724 domain-containing protein 3-like isoform X2 n=1 Tax=Prunus avium TaxID=42229 RepID=A0A6P5TMT8_PRUAV|nr:DUF724 domain-containing protein 3-like isoform X2 [Prunus avium]